MEAPKNPQADTVIISDFKDEKTATVLHGRISFHWHIPPPSSWNYALIIPTGQTYLLDEDAWVNNKYISWYQIIY